MIPFNKPFLTGNETKFIEKAHSSSKLAGDGKFTNLCHSWLEKSIGSSFAFLTHSCTAALEMTALLLEVKEGDEIIMPSYTFVSTANAFVLRGGIPVFVDIRKDTLNIDENLIEGAITSNTKAIVVVHYAGVSCEIEKIMKIANNYNLSVIEDAAQGLLSSYKGKALDGFGDFGCISFHETKNIHCGEGGALVINNKKFAKRAEIIRDKGTNRSQFFRGQVDKYRWVDVGSSYLPGELTAAFLYAQFKDAEWITQKRIDVWNKYYEIFGNLEDDGKVKRPSIPEDCNHNGHIFYLILDSSYNLTNVLRKMRQKNADAVFHYQPLHSSPAGQKFGKSATPLKVTESTSERLIRLPVWIGFNEHEKVLNALNYALKKF